MVTTKATASINIMEQLTVMGITKRSHITEKWLFI